jgi:hypothetical protein
MDRTGNTAPNSSSIVACVFIAARRCLPSRCQATHRHQGVLRAPFYVYQNKERRLKIKSLYSLHPVVIIILIRFVSPLHNTHRLHINYHQLNVFIS